MSRHDEVRLEAALALPENVDLNTLAPEALRKLFEDTRDAICGLQSTDDPSPIYWDTHNKLQKRLTEIDEVMRARGVPIATMLWDRNLKRYTEICCWESERTRLAQIHSPATPEEHSPSCPSFKQP